MARHSVAANLAGHDSHGVIMIPTYIGRIDVGDIVPGAPYEITVSTTYRVCVWHQLVPRRYLLNLCGKCAKSWVSMLLLLRMA